MVGCQLWLKAESPSGETPELGHQNLYLYNPKIYSLEGIFREADSQPWSGPTSSSVLSVTVGSAWEFMLCQGSNLGPLECKALQVLFLAHIYVFNKLLTLISFQ